MDFKKEEISEVERYNKEEFFNTITHGLGFLFSIVATIFLWKKAMEVGSITRIWGSLTFGFSMMFLYLASTLYHLIPFNLPKTKDIFRRIDQTAIYWLIAGTNSAFFFFYLSGQALVVSLSILWGIALLGSIYKLFYTDDREWVSVTIYFIMGVGGFLAVPYMSGELTQEVFNWISLGCLFYTLGLIFYLQTKMRWHHVIWHLYVLAGTTGHFIAVLESYEM